MKIILALLGFGLIALHSSAVLAGEGHDAGYQWAEEHDITDTDYSNGNSESFNEGVRQYAEEQLEDSEYDGEYSEEQEY